MAALRPRPEAARMTWHELCAPERTAVRALLLRLFGAIDELDMLDDSSRSGVRRHHRTSRRDDGGDEQRLATGFLITGNRGTGKTTVLLNAAEATSNPERFFDGAAEAGRFAGGAEGSQGERQQEAQLRRLADGYRRRLHWLDPLDMELLPDDTNLLTTLLVRIRDALDGAVDEGGDGARRGRADVAAAEWGESEEGERWRRVGAVPPRLLGEGHDLVEAWRRLDDLISKATLMWEGVGPGTDPRKRVEPQIQVAETYADIQDDLRRALDHASCELGRRLGMAGTPVTLVFPIDNADRGGRYAFDILKLIRIVYCPRLWFVIAASEQDLSRFVETEIRRKLTEGTSAVGGDSDLDGVARRRAAAIRLAALPPAHRVDVTLMRPDDVLSFKLPGSDGTTLGKLLGDAAFNVGFPGRPSMTLLDLMVLAGGKGGGAPLLSDKVHGHLVMASQECHGQPTDSFPNRKDAWFSRAGRQALTMPVRKCLDLWQAAQRWRIQSLPFTRSDDTLELGPPERAIYLVEEMLRSAIAESDLPNWAYRILSDRVIGRDAGNRVCFDLRGNPITWSTRSSQRDLIDLDLRTLPGGEHAPHGRAGKAERWLTSTVVVHDYYGFEMSVGDGRGQSQRLDAGLSGWLMLLYDLLQTNAEPRLIQDSEQPLFHENPLLVETQHRVALTGDRLTTLSMPWTMPFFDRFLDFDLLAWMWQAFLQHMLPVLREPEGNLSPKRESQASQRAVRCRAQSVDLLVRIMLTAWTDCILTTCLLTMPQKDLCGSLGAAEPKEERHGGEDTTWRTIFWREFEFHVTEKVRDTCSQDPQIARPAGDGSQHQSPAAVPSPEQAWTNYRAVIYETLSELHGVTRRGPGGGGNGDRQGEDLTFRWAQIRAWIEHGARLLQTPEYLATAAQPIDGPGELVGYWKRHGDLLAWKRYEKIREAIEGASWSERKDARPTEMKWDDSARRQSAITEMCRAWFEAVSWVPGNEALDPLTAGPAIRRP